MSSQASCLFPRMPQPEPQVVIVIRHRSADSPNRASFPESVPKVVSMEPDADIPYDAGYFDTDFLR